MCGIAGIFSADRPVSAGGLVALAAGVAHRGPDGRGTWLGGDGRCGLAHTRLAILDPDARSDQPFSAALGPRTLRLVFNGEIYNFRELRAELASLLPDFAWRTSGDTEVIPAAYLAWGEAFVGRLRGMFAFAMYDESDGSLLLARDRMGQKPLFVAHTADGSMAFCSELAPLAALEGVDTRVSPEALGEYLAFGYTLAPRTIYAGIEELPPATVRRVSADGKSRDSVYYRAGGNGSTSSPEQLGREIERAVGEQLVSDVPLGCFLSGGVDSSVVACCAAAALGRSGGRLRTFCVGFDDARYDESGFAEEVARHIGSEHQTFTVRPDAAADLELLARRYGQPFGDSSCLPTYYLAKATREHVKVALSGDGGDELLGGYDRYRAMCLPPAVASLVRLLGPLGDAGAHPKSWRARLARFSAAAGLPLAERYESLVRLFPPGLLGAPAYFGRGNWTGHPAVSAMRLDQRTYLPGDLLTKLDRASMAVALEVRSPFMDHLVVEAANGLGWMGGKKRLLRRLFGSRLPASVFTRAKRGFAVPIGQWLRGPLGPMLRDLTTGGGSFSASHFDRGELRRLNESHQDQSRDHSERLFAILMLELWWRTVRG
jgi:asparagine synthase (glutamine-hydrolysing)